MKLKSLLFLFFLVIVTDITFAEMKFDQDKPIYTSDAMGYEISQISNVLQTLFESQKPVILFVHGRGNEPQKSLKGVGRKKRGLAVKKLEKQYKSKVLMFNWDSKRKPGPFNILNRSRPIENMPSAVESFKLVLDEVIKYRSKNDIKKPFILLAHSMGTIVIQKYLEKYDWPSKKKEDRIFTNVLFTGADADNRNHAIWMEKISRVEQFYISINEKDSALKKSNKSRKKGVLPLGREPDEPLAEGAIYIDVTKTKSHEIFNKKKLKGHIHACQFFDTVLTGKHPVFSLKANVSKLISEQRYQLKYKKNKKHSCFIY